MTTRSNIPVATAPHLRTTDERFVKIDGATWWDTAGVMLVRDRIVEAYLDANPNVGIMVGRTA